MPRFVFENIRSGAREAVEAATREEAKKALGWLPSVTRFVGEARPKKQKPPAKS